MRMVWAVGMLLFSSLAVAGATEVSSVRVWPAPDSTRVVFDISAPADYNLFTLKDPHRVVIDINHADLNRSLTLNDAQGGVLEGVRSAPRGDKLRVVLDLNQAVKPKSFLLQPNRKYGHRLVIDLQKPGHKAPVKAIEEHQTQGLRPVVIAIDAGHGGEDPGALGRRGTKEKDAVLAVARHLERLVRASPGMMPVMTRDGDYYLSLRERTEKARANKADLFVSIHADAFRDSRVRGSSVYALSRHGASDEAARWLAEKENNADLIGGVSLDDKDDLLASVLLDLSQTASIGASLDVGDRVLEGLGDIGKLHKHSVQQAGFAVLKSPDIPSILVETAFISNPVDEAHLRDRRHQLAIAKGIFDGIKDYFYRHPPTGTRLASHTPRTHVISPGDTLFDLAKRYQVNVRTLRSVNDLSGDVLRVGQTLQIPADSGS